MQPNGYIKVAAMPGGSLPTTRRHLPTQQKGGILYPIIKIPYNNSKNTSTTNPITISNTNTTTNTTVINYNPIIPSTAPNRRKLPTTAANNGISGSGKLDCKKVLPPSKSLNSAVTPITPINTTGYELIWIDYNNGVSGSTGNENKPNLKEPEVEQPEVENTGLAVLPLVLNLHLQAIVRLIQSQHQHLSTHDCCESQLARQSNIMRRTSFKQWIRA